MIGRNILIALIFGFINLSTCKNGLYRTNPSNIKYLREAKGTKTPVINHLPLENYFGINGFEWDFEDPKQPGIIDDARYQAVKYFTQIRHYIDWSKLEASPGNYTFNPTANGSWNYDSIYVRCKTDGIEVLADIKSQPEWIMDYYPTELMDAENVPVIFGKDFTDPTSYAEQAKLGFQFAARYGSNTGVDKTLLTVNTKQRWPGDTVNVIRVGLNLINYIECDNERDKWWKGRKAYQTSFEYAANLSAFYDGHKNSMGPGVGVKNADPRMKVVMGGLATADPNYVAGMIRWCKIFRGYHADGTINLCWDIINYHLYSTNSGTSQHSSSTSGARPEIESNIKIAKDFLLMSHDLANDMPVWITETGYDSSKQSPYHTFPINNKSALLTQADWTLRTSLLYSRLGIQKVFFFELYDDNAENPGPFGTSGLLNHDRSRRPAADYLFQTNSLFGKYSYKESLSTDPIVDRYEYNGKSAYILYVPDQTGRSVNYLLRINNKYSAKIYTPQAGNDHMSESKGDIVNGLLKILITETPVFILPD